jgi:hypothetical protein
MDDWMKDYKYRAPPFPAQLTLTPGVHPSPTCRLSG